MTVFLKSQHPCYVTIRHIDKMTQKSSEGQNSTLGACDLSEINFPPKSFDIPNSVGEKEYWAILFKL